MNVLHFINNLSREGAQVMVSNLVSAVDKGPISYSVCVRQPGGPLAAELRAKGVRVFEPPGYFGFWSTSRSVAFLLRVCRENQIGIIHAHMADAAFLGWLTARKLKLPLIISHHGHDILLKCNPACRLVYYVLLNLAARYAAMNVAVSSSVAERVSRLLRVKKNALRVIGNGVRIPDEAQLEKMRKHRRDRRSKPRIVTVGRLVPLKGQRQLIYAMKGLLEIFPQARLIIVGGGDLGRELERLAQIENVAAHVEFTGAVDDVRSYLASADVYVSSSQSEGMPVSILEAMAWQLPIVASDIPGNRNVVEPGITGFLYELNNTQDLVEALTSVVNNAEQSRAMALQARTMAIRDYSVAASEKAHAELYLKIAQNNE